MSATGMLLYSGRGGGSVNMCTKLTLSPGTLPLPRSVHWGSGRWQISHSFEFKRCKSACRFSEDPAKRFRSGTFWAQKMWLICPARSHSTSSGDGRVSGLIRKLAIGRNVLTWVWYARTPLGTDLFSQRNLRFLWQNEVASPGVALYMIK